MENQNQPTILTPPILNNPPASATGDGYDDVLIKIPDNILGIIKLSESPDSIYHYFVASPMYAGFGDLSSSDRIYFLQDFKTMPPGIRNYFTSADTLEIIFSVGKEYNFEDGQISQLSTLIRELLTGKIFIKDFPMAISSKLGIDDVKAGEITNSLVSKSFGPIIEDVKRIQRGKFPDKVMAMQKESQPAGLSPKPQPSGEINNMPLTQPNARQDVQSVRPPAVSPVTPPVDPVPQQNKPPVPQAPIDFSQVRQAQNRPGQSPLPQLPTLSPAKPELQSRGSSIASQNLSDSGAIGTPVVPPVMPAPKLPPRPQFKMPDLDPQINPALQNQSKPFEPGQPKPLTPPSPPAKLEQSQKSLEDELLKVANVIDLRAKSEE